MLSPAAIQLPSAARPKHVAQTESPLHQDRTSADSAGEIIWWHGVHSRNVQRGCDVLLVEGDPYYARLLERALRRGGFSVRTARSGRDVLPLIASLRPGLILIDWQTPDLDGPAFVRRLKQRPEMRRIPVIAMTGYARSGDRAHALRAGCDGFLCKPVLAEQLLAEVARLLALGASSPRLLSPSRLPN